MRAPTRCVCNGERGVFRVAAALGVVALIGLIDTIVNITVALMWGDRWGCRFDNTLLFAVAFAGIWAWTGRQGNHTP